MFGELIAWAVAHEEQARKTLHGHWHLWIEDFKRLKERMLFHENKDIRRQAVEKYQEYIDQVMSASYGSVLEVVHQCIEEETVLQASTDSSSTVDIVAVDTGVDGDTLVHDSNAGSDTFDASRKVEELF